MTRHPLRLAIIEAERLLAAAGVDSARVDAELLAAHVLGVRVGQPIEISNSDDTLHNVNARGDVNQPFNIGQFQKGMKNTTTFTAQEVMIRFKCDVHPWMNAYAGVVSHPYFAVTKDGVLISIHDLTLERTTNVEEVFPDRFVERTEGPARGKRWHPPSARAFRPIRNCS